jgi:putative transposase
LSSAKAKPKRSASYDASLYKKHNIVERFLSKLKAVQARRNPLRQTLANLMGFVKLAAIAIWLR